MNSLFKTGKQIKVKVDKSVDFISCETDGTITHIHETKKGFHVYIAIDKFDSSPAVITVKDGELFPLEITNGCYLFDSYIKNNKKNESYVEFLESIILEIRNAPKF